MESNGNNSLDSGEPTPAPQPSLLYSLRSDRHLVADCVLASLAVIIGLVLLLPAHRQFEAISFRLGLIVALSPLAPLFFGVMLPWFRSYRRDRLMDQWRAGDYQQRAEYFRSDAYQDCEADRQQFGGADQAHENVLAWLRSSTDHLLFLTGDAGVGKSSLLNAYVIPQLGADKGRPVRVIRLRCSRNPVAELRQQLLTPKVIWQQPPQGADKAALLTLLQKACADLQKRNIRLLLVFDDVEELIASHTDDRRPTAESSDAAKKKRDPLVVLGQFLQLIQAEPIPGLVSLLVVETKYRRKLKSLNYPPLVKGENSWMVKPFTARAARKFLENGFDKLSETPRLSRWMTSEAAAIDGERRAYRPNTLNLVGRTFASGLHSNRTDGQRTVRRWISHAAIFLGLIGILVLGPVYMLSARHAAERLKNEYGAKISWRDGQGWKVNIRHDRITDLSGVTPVIRRLGDVRRVSLHDCNSLADIGALRKLPTLQSVWIDGTDSLVNLDGISELNELEELELFVCPSLTNVNQLASLTSLRSLAITHSDSLIDLNGLAALTRLRHLSVTSCEVLVNINALDALTQMQTLELRVCDLLTDISPLRAMTNLRSLILVGCDSVTDVGVLREMTNLQSLELFGCDSVTDFSVLRVLNKLQSLTLGGSLSDKEIDTISNLTNLRSLDVNGCRALKTSQVLTKLTNLESLDISYCEELTDLSGLQKLTRLERLNLLNLRQLKDLTPLYEMDSLRVIVLGPRDFAPEQVQALRHALPNVGIYNDLSYFYGWK
jgi:hypothetical protein